MEAKALMVTLAETGERLTKARQRGARGEVKWLTDVQDALREYLGRLALEAADEKTRAENVASAKRTVAAFDGSDWMGQGEKQ